MAFSYSDKDFTVIGNLCFVHILLKGTDKMIDIPPAIAERILGSRIICTYPCLSSKEVGGSSKEARVSDSFTKDIGYALIVGNKISLTNVGEGYLYFYFPIDSNK